MSLDQYTHIRARLIVNGSPSVFVAYPKKTPLSFVQITTARSIGFFAIVFSLSSVLNPNHFKDVFAGIVPGFAIAIATASQTRACVWSIPFAVHPQNILHARTASRDSPAISRLRFGLDDPQHEDSILDIRRSASSPNGTTPHVGEGE